MLYVSRVMTLEGVGRATSCVTAGAPGCLVVAERATPVAQDGRVVLDVSVLVCLVPIVRRALRRPVKALASDIAL